MKQMREWILFLVYTGLCCLGSLRTSVSLAEPGSGIPQGPKQTRMSDRVGGDQTDRIILPGASLGSIHLGDSEKQVQAHFRLKPNVDEQMTREGCGAKVTEIHWLDLEFRHNGVWFYLRDGVIFQIRSSTPRFHTKRGITADSTADVVRRTYPNLSAFRLVNSGNQATGWKDHVYWVDKRSGIAFEFYYNEHSSQWRVLSVFIFKPEVEFLPTGCISPPQKWKQIPPYGF